MAGTRHAHRALHAGCRGKGGRGVCGETDKRDGRGFDDDERVGAVGGKLSVSLTQVDPTQTSMD